MSALDVDPTRTGMLRRKLTRDVEQRFNLLTHAINDHIGKEDFLTLNAFKFESLPSKLEGYKKWLLSQVKAKILLVDEANQTTPWLNEYIQSAYKLASTRAYAAVRKAGVSEEGLKEFTQSFSLPIAQQRLQLLYMRAFEALKGVTQAMSNTMSRVLASSLAHGLGAREAAKLLIEQVGFSKKRALVIARTELINAYIEGQLDGFQKLGVNELGVQVEHLTAGDDRVCPKCRSLSGKLYKSIEEARGVIPVHPNCGCAWAPYVDIKKLLGEK